MPDRKCNVLGEAALAKLTPSTGSWRWSGQAPAIGFIDPSFGAIGSILSIGLAGQWYLVNTKVP